MDTSSTIFLPSPATPQLPLREWFGNPTSLELDIGCGKGRFLLARAVAHPDTAFVGIDRQLKRLRRLDRRIQRAGLSNVRLVRAEAAYVLAFLVPPASIRTCYAFFPDPWPKRRHHRRRLFSPEVLDALCRILCPGGVVQAATDHLEYCGEIRKLFEADDRFEPAPVYEPPEPERTDFELAFISAGRPIGRCAYRTRGP